MFNRKPVLRSPMDADTGDVGGAIDASAPVPPAPPPAAPAQDTKPEPKTEAKPASMLEAMQRVWDRDDKGRFAGGAKEVPAVAASDAPAPEAQPKQEPTPKQEPDDPLAMPDGLGQKAQERFQRLATSNRELTERVQQAEQQVSYVRESFQKHGVRQEQFEQAMAVVGAINGGDYAAAQRILSEQLRHLALLTGQQVTGLDALTDFPDLRQSVDNFQMTEAAALELARHRMSQSAMQQRSQNEQMARQRSNAEQQAFSQAQAAVDAWTRQMAAQDIDWPAIEEQILPDIAETLKGVPPNAWLNVLQSQYSALKRAAQKFKPAPTQEPVPLRPVGAGAPQRAPQSMAEAMWGNALRA